MKIVLSLNNQERLYDYISMGIDTFILGGQYSFHCPYVFSLDDMIKIIGNYPEQIWCTQSIPRKRKWSSGCCK